MHMAIAKILTTIFVILTLAGCAHPMGINPDLNKIALPDTAQAMQKHVAYYISDTMLQTEVTSGGGAGDKVSYFPYRDMELALYKMLSNIFGEVTRLKNPLDKEALAARKIVYLITPQISTASSSSSALTWPPTHFSVDLTCIITNPGGKEVVSKKVVGIGAAEFSEFKKDPSVTGRRAVEDAVLKMQQALLAAPVLRE